MGIENKQQTPAVPSHFSVAFKSPSSVEADSVTRDETGSAEEHEREDDECSGDKCFSLP